MAMGDESITSLHNTNLNHCGCYSVVKPNQIPELIKGPIGDIEDAPIEEKVSILLLEKGVC